MLINVGDMTQLSELLKDLNPKNILRITLDFYLELSKLLDLD